MTAKFLKAILWRLVAFPFFCLGIYFFQKLNFSGLPYFFENLGRRSLQVVFWAVSCASWGVGIWAIFKWRALFSGIQRVIWLCCTGFALLVTITLGYLRFDGFPDEPCGEFLDFSFMTTAEGSYREFDTQELDGFKYTLSEDVKGFQTVSWFLDINFSPSHMLRVNRCVYSGTLVRLGEDDLPKNLRAVKIRKGKLDLQNRSFKLTFTNGAVFSQKIEVPLPRLQEVSKNP